jgi:hypothetical protein
VEALASLKVPLSHDKSFASDKVAEFVGHLILDDMLFKPTKWRQVNLDSFKEFLEVWGWEGIQLLPRHLRKPAEVVAELPEPVGLGLNPKGKTLYERLVGFEELYSSKVECPVVLPKRSLGSPGTVLRLYESLADAGILLDIPIYQPDNIVKRGRADLRLFTPGCLSPELQTELNMLSKFQHLYNPKDIQVILSDLLKRHSGVRLGALLEHFGVFVPPVTQAKVKTFYDVIVEKSGLKFGPDIAELRTLMNKAEAKRRKAQHSKREHLTISSAFPGGYVVKNTYFGPVRSKNLAGPAELDLDNVRSPLRGYPVIFLIDLLPFYLLSNKELTCISNPLDH